ncbi:MAG: DUF1566 domain-containing protein [Deltaproteobacteria bacterium]|nr:DUF1566 domain-containing protein [Deltaproteobacteria bacterium]
MPNPVSTGLPNPQSYDVSTAGIVLDKVTGLVWQSAANTSGMLWPAARNHCLHLSLAGADDWRLPSFIELVSLVDFSRRDPAIDTTAFPRPVGGTVWTSTPVLGSPSEAWYVSFNNGFTYQGHENLLPIDVRCVRGGAVDPVGARYAFPTPQTVSDKQTGLLWQRTADGQTRTWDAAVAVCRALDLSGPGWRLPSMKELQTLLDLSRQLPALDPVAFPIAPTEQYWTSSTLKGSATDAWFISFRLGAASTIGRDNPSFVRCVR